jgi:L-proline 4-hydroxylase
VRSIYGSHDFNDTFHRLTRDPRIIGPVKQILGAEVFVYQFKINIKAAFDGDLWEWHQDFIFWQKEDGLKEPRVTSVAIFLNEATEFNGPMYVLPGSHKAGNIDVQAHDDVEVRPSSDRAWMPNLTAKLRYSLSRNIVGDLVSRHGMAALKGPAGSVVFFHSQLVHGSPNNLSPFDRAVIIITFCSIDNIPSHKQHRRPEFLVGSNYEPIVPLDGEECW